MKDYNRDKKDESGSITVEASVALSVFVFAIVTILSVINICIIQARISYAITATAKEISEYSYLYSLTGLNDRAKEISDAGTAEVEPLNSMLSSMGEVFNGIQSLSKTVNDASGSISEIDPNVLMNEATQGWETVEGAVASIRDKMADIADNPTAIIFGMAKLASVEAYNFLGSILAQELAKVLCQKHLTNVENGDPDQYLRKLGVINGFEGLKFEGSSMFINGSSTIKIRVTYKAKIIPLLPINATFGFSQVAITQGWMAGNVSFNSDGEKMEKKYVENLNMWTGDPEDRAELMIKLAMNTCIDEEGWERINGKKEGTRRYHLYDPDDNAFVMFATSNPLLGDSDEPLKMEDVSREHIKEIIERNCATLRSAVDLTDNSLSTYTENGGTKEYHERECTNPNAKLVLIIPEDEGVAEIYKEVVNEAETHGVEVIIYPAYGEGSHLIEENTTSTDNGG